MSYVHELYRQEALGLISSREFDRRFDDAVEQDMIDSMAQRYLDAEYEAYLEEAQKEYYEDIINSMNPHDRKHELNPGRMYLKGGHTHNHIYNKCHKHIFRSKQARKNVDHKDKPEFVRIFLINLELGNYSFDKLLHTIFHHNKKGK